MPEEVQVVKTFQASHEGWMERVVQDYCRHLPLEVVEKIMGIYQRYGLCPALEAAYVVMLLGRMRP